MSAQAAPNQLEKSSVENIVKELIDINSEIFELKEDIVARGVPFGTLNALVDMKARGPSKALDDFLDTALSGAVKQYGHGAISAEALVNHLDKLVELEADLQHVRKISKSFNYEPQAVNLLTSVMRQNPGDNGAKVINKIVEYAGRCGIEISGLQLVTNNDREEPVSVLPDIKIESEKRSNRLLNKQTCIDLALGMAIAVCGLVLLT